MAIQPTLGDVDPVERVVVPNGTFGEFVAGIDMEGSLHGLETVFVLTPDFSD